MKPQINSLATGLAITFTTLAICYLLTALVLTSAGYPMW
mgnify:CR=1 FL=1|jgi:hypothetical protein